jgi:hypothetical protein
VELGSTGALPPVVGGSWATVTAAPVPCRNRGARSHATSREAPPLPSPPASAARAQGQAQRAKTEWEEACKQRVQLMGPKAHNQGSKLSSAYTAGLPLTRTGRLDFSFGLVVRAAEEEVLGPGGVGRGRAAGAAYMLHQQQQPQQPQVVKRSARRQTVPAKRAKSEGSLDGIKYVLI